MYLQMIHVSAWEKIDDDSYGGDYGIEYDYSQEDTGCSTENSFSDEEVMHIMLELNAMGYYGHSVVSNIKLHLVSLFTLYTHFFSK